MEPGSDSGVAIGQKLTVYRLFPQGLFLGYIEITAVQPHQAVGKLSGTMRQQIKVGDRIKP